MVLVVAIANWLLQVTLLRLLAMVATSRTLSHSHVIDWNLIRTQETLLVFLEHARTQRIRILRRNEKDSACAEMMGSRARARLGTCELDRAATELRTTTTGGVRARACVDADMQCYSSRGNGVVV